MSEAKKVAEPVETPSLFKAKKERSPSYPAYNLEQCLDRAKQFYSFAKRNAARTTDASKHWGFSEKSSGGRLTIAALLKFGLLDEEGRGEDRGVRLSELALHILLDEQPDSPDRLALIKRAALLPTIHSHLWEKYGADTPADMILRTYLKRDMKYTDSAVDDLIAEYKATIAFAKLSAGDKIEDEAGVNADTRQQTDVKVGDLVQWTSGGVNQFDPPQPVLGFSPNKAFLFVPGTGTGIPVSEVTVVGRAMSDTDKKGTPPVNPFKDAPFAPAKPPADTSPPAGFKEDAYDLAEGRAVFRWPEKLDPGSVAELEDWFGLIIRKMQRMTGATPTKTDKKKTDNKGD
jgi:hypothetical protein